MNEELLKSIDRKVTKTNEDLHTITSRLVRVETTIEQFQVNIQRFYDRDMGPLLQAVQKNQESIARIQIELAQLKTKIAVWGSVGVFFVSSVMSIVVKNYF